MVQKKTALSLALEYKNIDLALGAPDHKATFDIKVATPHFSCCVQ